MSEAFRKMCLHHQALYETNFITQIAFNGYNRKIFETLMGDVFQKGDVLF